MKARKSREGGKELDSVLSLQWSRADEGAEMTYEEAWGRAAVNELQWSRADEGAEMTRGFFPPSRS